MSSGLDQLTAQRERSSRRTMPPPRNPPRATPVALPAEPEHDAVVPETDHPAAESPQDEPGDRAIPAAVAQSAVAPALLAPTPGPVATGTKTVQRPAKAAPVKPPPAVESAGPDDDLAKYSIYFDGTADEFLEATRVAGRRLRPKLSISRSSVVRLALERLSDSMSPDEVAAELSRNAAAARSATGRPRL